MNELWEDSVVEVLEEMERQSLRAEHAIRDFTCKNVLCERCNPINHPMVDYAGTEKLHAAVVVAYPHDPQFVNERPNPNAPSFWPID